MLFAFFPVGYVCLRRARFCAATACLLSNVAAANPYSNAVDLYNSVSGTWSTAQLSVGRWGLAGASAGNLAIFAGGRSTSNSSFILHAEGMFCFYFEVVMRLWGRQLVVTCVRVAAACRLMRFAAGSTVSNAVDLYSSVSGTWSTAQLSLARARVGITVVRNVTIFAGGTTTSSTIFCCMLKGCRFRCCDVSWRFMREACSLSLRVCAGAACRLMRVTAGHTNAVDLYDITSGIWSTAQLSAARYFLSAVTVGNEAIFAGGCTFNGGNGNSSFPSHVAGLLFAFLLCLNFVDACDF